MYFSAVAVLDFDCCPEQPNMENKNIERHNLIIICSNLVYVNDAVK